MPDRVRILSARRAYEFGRDDLRLTMLSSLEIRQRIQQQFNFEVAQVATPVQTFGPVPTSLPPGLVFDVGSARLPEGPSVLPIRFIHFEALRIVIDAVGPSSSIDLVFDQIKEIVSEFAMPDGSPIIDEPLRVLEYSEISAHFDFGFDALIDKAMLRRVQHLVGNEHTTASLQPMGITFRATDGPDGNSTSSYTFEVRGGTRPEERIYFSSAGVRTDEHLAWLDALEKDLSGR